MLSELKKLVEILVSALPGLRRLSNARTRSRTILDLLCIYFVLLDVVKDGRKLLEKVGSNPRLTLTRISPSRAKQALGDWDQIIKRQASRLDHLAACLLAQDALAVLDPKLKDRLEHLVGDKFDRTSNLAGVGAGLVMYSAFGDGTDAEWQRGVILSLYPAKGSLIDIRAAKRELRQLDQTLEAYRQICIRITNTSEVLRISKKARSLTSLGRD